MHPVLCQQFLTCFPLLVLSVSRKIKKENMELLGLKDNDKLTFVYQKVYNSGPVKMIRKSNKSGSISASCQKMLHVLIKVSECDVYL